MLGVPPILDGTGAEIAEGVLSLLEEWDIASNKIAGMCFDTMASNTGVWNGACIKIEEAIGHKLLYVPCRHHVAELHSKHVAIKVGRPTKGVEDQLFKKFGESWNDMLDQGIDLEGLNRLDLENCSSLLKAEAEKTLVYLSGCLRFQV